MLKKYKVIALSVGGLNKKIFNSGDIVSEDNFYEGRADKLVAAGFLQEINSQEEIPLSGLKEPKKLWGIDAFDIHDLKINLKNNGIYFDPNSSKQQLYDKYVELYNPVKD